MAETYMQEGVEYYATSRRMVYNPEYHPNHGKPWMVNDLVYLCSSWDGMKKADIALALGRTHGTVLSKAYELKKSGDFDNFKNMAAR